MRTGEKLLSKIDIERILSQRFENDRFTRLSELPSPEGFKDIQKAALRIKEAIEKNEKITIVGDYDTDGVVASLILASFFDDIDYKYDLIIPNRFKDGYGLSKRMIDEIDSDLIITVDNGTSAVEAAETCKEKGIDLIITDHHVPPKVLPDAYAIVNAKQKDCDFEYEEICGAQVAWYLIANLKKVLGLKEYDLSKYIDLLGIAIVADMMVLNDMYMTLVMCALIIFNIGQSPAMR